MPILALNSRLVVETMTGIDPIVNSHPQRIHHSMHVAASIEWPKQNFTRIANAVLIGISQIQNIRNRKAKNAIAVR